MKFLIFFLSVALRTLVNITKYIHFYFNFTFLKCNYFLSRMHQWKKLYTSWSINIWIITHYRIKTDWFFLVHSILYSSGPIWVIRHKEAWEAFSSWFFIYWCNLSRERKEKSLLQARIQHCTVGCNIFNV